MKTKCCICDAYIDDLPCPHAHTQLELERGSKRAVRRTAIRNNTKLGKEFGRNETLIKKLTCELEQIEVEILMAAAEKKQQEAGHKIDLSSLCPKCGSISEPINDYNISWECLNCGCMYQLKDLKAIAQLKAGTHSDNNQFSEGGRSQ